MTTGLSLFGGLAAVVLLFVAVRQFRSGAELAGMIAGGVPLLAYLLTLFGRWPGLDVVAIHIAVYLVAAFVLVVFERYRARQQKMHWVPKLLIAFFALLVVVNAGLLYIATNGLPAGMAGLFLPGEAGQSVHTGFSGTTRHGQDAAKSIGSDLSRQHQNLELGWQISIEGLRKANIGENSIYIRAEDGHGQALTGLMGSLSVARPGALAVQTPVRAVSAGYYEARIQLPARGLWLIGLEMRQQDKVWKQTWEITVPEDQ